MLMRFFFVCVGLATLCLLYGFLIEPKRLAVRDIPLELGLDTPLRVVLLSDVHGGGHHVDDVRVADLVREVNAQKPDLVLMAGDYVTGHDPRFKRTTDANEKIDAALAEFAGFEATHGVYAVLGNHDHWYNAPFIQQAMEASGIRFIDNQPVSVAGLCLFGLADEWEGEPALETMMECEEGMRVGLMHNPDTAFRLPETADLLLAGHTHGGQINLPVFGRRVTATRAGRPYAYGLKAIEDYPIYITSGVGTSGLPARFRAPPEIVTFTLR